MIKFKAKGAVCILIFIVTASIFICGHALALPASDIDRYSSENNIVQIIGIDSTAYPKIRVNVFIDEMCASAGGLVKDDFTVEEGGTEVEIDNFYFTGRASGQKLDLAVVFDETDTMADEIDAMQAKVEDLTDKIKSSNIDARYSLVTFKTEVLPKIEWTDDADVFKEKVDQLRASGGNYQRPENSLGGVARVLSFGFRSNAQKIIIVITDEPSMQRGDGWSNSPYHEDDVLQDLLDAGVMLVAVSPDFRAGTIPSNIPRSDLPLYTDMRDLAQSSGGLWININSADFSVILDQLEEIITGSYMIEYTSPVTMNTGSKTVTVSVNAPDCVEGGVSSTYMLPASSAAPNEPPMIIDLISDKTSPQSSGSTVTWTVEAVDPDGDQVLYRFFLKDEAMTDWKTEKTWTWEAQDDGSYRIEAQVRDGKHAGSNGMDNRKSTSFEITGPNNPPSISSLTSDKTSPQEVGSIIIWATEAVDPDGDQVLYRFFLNDEPMTEWTTEKTWTWTAPAEVGMYRVEAQVRDGTHAGPNGMDDRRLVSFEITRSNEPPTISGLTPDKASPQEAGSAITWTAEAGDPDGDQVLYRFFLDDEPMTDWMTENSWTWTFIEPGLHWYEVQVRDGKHAGPDGMDDRMLSNVEIDSPNRPPAVNSLETDKLSPQESGSIIFWNAAATDAEGDDLEYRFLLNGGTVRDWSSNSTWEWITSVSDIGSHEIEVTVRDGKHDLDGDDSRSKEFEVKASEVSFVEFNRAYGGFVYQHLLSAKAVQPTLNGGYILAIEATPLWGSSGRDAWLIKTDSEGHEVWSSVIGGKHDDFPYSIQPTSDGGYILAGMTYSRPVASLDALLIKTDSEGREVWSRTFGGSDRGELFYAFSVRPTPDGGYILAGMRKTPYGSTDAWLIKTNSEGREVWSKTFGGASDDSVSSVQLTLDGGYVLAGTTSSFGSGGKDAWLIKTDSEGHEVWNRTFGGASDDSVSSVQLTLDGGYILAGSNAWLIKTDSEGHEVWNRTFGRTSSECSVHSTPDSGYILAGSGLSLGSRGNYAWLIKTDSGGNIVQLPSGGQPTVRSDTSGDFGDAIEAFENQNEYDGIVACVSLVEIGEPAVDPLIEALKDENWRTRYYAAYALGKIGDSRAVDPLIETRDDENRWVRGSAAYALGEISGPAAVDNLIETLKDEDSETRGWAAVFLGAARDPRAIVPLIDAMKDEDGWVREVAAMALGKIGNPMAVDSLIEVLKDEDDWVRKEAARALGEIGDPKAVDPLIEALEDEYEGTRGYAAEALGKIGDPKAADPLTK